MQESQIMFKIKVIVKIENKVKKIKLKGLTLFFFFYNAIKMTTIWLMSSWSLFLEQFFALQSTYFATLFDVKFAYYDILIYIKYYITNSHYCSTRLHQHYICKIHQWNTNLIIFLGTSTSNYLNCEAHGYNIIFFIMIFFALYFL